MAPRHDLELLRQYRDTLKDMPKFDKKADAVAETILRDGALQTGGKKVLVFTEYTATATYVKEFLQYKFGDKKVGIITGNVGKSKRLDIIRRFSPTANTGEDEQMPDDDLDILVSTEVLSEGQNLQDCNYVINYDLPWNPMRIVQRIGRVDRLTSTHDVVHSRECFPDEKLDELLTLVGKLMDKIGDINESVGLEADLLGQEASPKNFKGSMAGRIQALASGNADRITEEMERESDLMPPRTPLNEISQHIKKAGIMEMERFSMGRRSGKAGERKKAVLAYVRETPKRRFHAVTYDYDTDQTNMVDDMDAIRLARCPEDEDTYLPADDAESFGQLLDIDRKARAEIAEQNSKDYRIAREMRTKRKKDQKTIEKIRNIIDDEAERGNLPISEAEEADAVLDSQDLLQWTDDLEDALEKYHMQKSIDALVSQLLKMRDSIGIEADGDEATESPGELTLVGAMFITPAGHP